MGRPKSILIAYDGSEAGRRALDAAADLVGYASTVAVVAVSGDRGPADDPLSKARHHLSSRHVFARYVYADGHPVERLLETADEIGADLVVLGGANGVTEAVVRRAPCDVLVVR